MFFKPHIIEHRGNYYIRKYFLGVIPVFIGESFTAGLKWETQFLNAHAFPTQDHAIEYLLKIPSIKKASKVRKTFSKRRNKKVKLNTKQLVKEYKQRQVLTKNS